MGRRYPAETAGTVVHNHPANTPGLDRTASGWSQAMSWRCGSPKRRNRNEAVHRGGLSPFPTNSKTRPTLVAKTLDFCRVVWYSRCKMRNANKTEHRHGI